MLKRFTENKGQGKSMHILFDSVVSATLQISIIDSLLIGVIAYLIALPFIFKKSLRNKVFYLFVFLYVSFSFFLTIPIVLQPCPNELMGIPERIGFVSREIIWNPLDSMLGVDSFRHFVSLIGGNFLLLMPIAVFILLKKPAYSWKKFLALSLGVSCGIEFIQFVSNVVIGYSLRTVETLDVLLNVSGALLCFFILKAVLTKRKEKNVK